MISYYGVGRLADLLVLDNSERRTHLLMPLQNLGGGLSVPSHGYLDETEHDDIVGVGGWLGTYETWQGFEPRWNALLPPEANGDFHYTDFLGSPKYGSARWSHEKRLDFIQSLAALVARHASIGMGIVISRSEYERIVPAEDQRAFRGPEYFCLGHCLRLLIEHYHTIPSKPPLLFDSCMTVRKGKKNG